MVTLYIVYGFEVLDMVVVGMEISTGGAMTGQTSSPLLD